METALSGKIVPSQRLVELERQRDQFAAEVDNLVEELRTVKSGNDMFGPICAKMQNKYSELAKIKTAIAAEQKEAAATTKNLRTSLTHLGFSQNLYPYIRSEDGGRCLLMLPVENSTATATTTTTPTPAPVAPSAWSTGLSTVPSTQAPPSTIPPLPTAIVDPAVPPLPPSNSATLASLIDVINHAQPPPPPPATPTTTPAPDAPPASSSSTMPFTQQPASTIPTMLSPDAISGVPPPPPPPASLLSTVPFTQPPASTIPTMRTPDAISGVPPPPPPPSSSSPSSSSPSYATLASLAAHIDRTRSPATTLPQATTAPSLHVTSTTTTAIINTSKDVPPDWFNSDPQRKTKGVRFSQDTIFKSEQPPQDRRRSQPPRAASNKEEDVAVEDEVDAEEEEEEEEEEDSDEDYEEEEDDDYEE